MASLVYPQKWQQRLSRNHNERPKGVSISAIVMHADASSRVDSTLDWARRPESKVSYHLLIGRTGNVFVLVHPELRAWHAGVSELDGVKDVNDFAIGVCLSNKNTGETYPVAQTYEAASVCATLCQFYQIPVERIVTHAEIAKPDGRKTDPFGFDMLAHKGLVQQLLKKSRTQPLR